MQTKFGMIWEETKADSFSFLNRVWNARFNGYFTTLQFSLLFFSNWPLPNGEGVANPGQAPFWSCSCPIRVERVLPVGKYNGLKKRPEERENGKERQKGAMGYQYQGLWSYIYILRKRERGTYWEMGNTLWDWLGCQQRHLGLAEHYEDYVLLRVCVVQLNGEFPWYRALHRQTRLANDGVAASVLSLTKDERRAKKEEEEISSETIGGSW